MQFAKKSDLPPVPLAEGGEGIIYKYKDKILKIFKPNTDLAVKQAKVERLLSKSLPPNVVGPEDIVMIGKNFAGYLMPEVGGTEFKMLSNRKFIKLHYISVDTVIQLLCRVQETLTSLHATGLYIGDLNDGNILFNGREVYFIDVDSWVVDEFKCSVVMDTFKDPQLIGDNFNANTDKYAFNVLAFKALTRIHPFGGTIPGNNVALIDRMSGGPSVFDSRVVVPKTTLLWDFMSPELLSIFRDVFDCGARVLPGDALTSLGNNLKFCQGHDNFYYARYNDCPVCSTDAVITDAPRTKAPVGQIPLTILSRPDDICMFINADIYLDCGGCIIHRWSGKKVIFNNRCKYYFSDDGNITYIVDERMVHIYVGKTQLSLLERLYKSEVVVIDDTLYFTSPNKTLTECRVSNHGVTLRSVVPTALNSIFSVVDDKTYAVCNVFDGTKIFHISGCNITYRDDGAIVNYGIHYDHTKKNWLFILEDSTGKFTTIILSSNKIEYSGSVPYMCPLNNLCIDNGTIYMPCDGYIEGFNYQKGVSKQFECEVVSTNSLLVRNKTGFTIVNDNVIYYFG